MLKTNKPMKLYTEEQLLNTVNAIQSYIKKFGIEGAQPTIKNHLKMLAPIELPSRDMAEEAFTNSCLSDSKEGNIDFINGFIWTVRQILNQNK